MKIIMLSWEYPPKIVGGISRVVYELSQKLGDCGHQVHVITCSEENKNEIRQDNKVLVHMVSPYKLETANFMDWVVNLNFAFIEYCVKLINKIGPIDIIHAHDWLVAYASRVLKHSYRVPLICTIHATEHGRNKGIHNEIQRSIHNMEWWLTYEAWKTICNSNYMKNEIMNIFQLPDDKINVISNGVASNEFKDIKKDQYFRRKFASDNEKIILFVGRLVSEKGVHVLIDAIPKITSHYNDIKLVIVGKGPELNNLRNKTYEMGISEKVYFTGYINDYDLKLLYKCADIAVYPSIYEPFGIVALEAMAANVPVIVTDTGGLNEIVEHGIDGLKAYADNSNSLADCILELLYNPALCEGIKTKALLKVESEYNWNQISKKTYDVYKNVIKEYKESGWKL